MQDALKSTSDVRHIILYAVITGFAAFLLFTNLGDRLLWGDEAETANLAVNITKYGIPKTFDDKNTITLFGSAVDANSSNVWVWSPWLKEYLAAASFGLFGVSTTTARLPFAMFAFAAVMLLMLVAYRVYLDHRVSLASAVLLLSSDLFILHARQCRYYSVVILAQILFIYGVYRFLAQRKWGAAYIVLALTMQFYCNYITVGGNLIALIVFIPFILHRPKAIKGFVFSITAFAVLAAPWLLYAKPWHQAKEMAKEDVFYKLLYYLSEIHFHVVPFAILLIPLVVTVMKRLMHKTPERSGPSDEEPRGRRELECFLWILIPCHLIFLSLVPGAYLRYLLPLIPVLFLLAAVIISRIRKPPLLAGLLLIALCLSNCISVASGYPFRGAHHLRLPLFNMVREITTPYADRLKDVVAFLRQNAKPDESLLVFDPEFPLIFYTRMEIIDGRFTHHSLQGTFPDWILSESASGVVESPATEPPPALYYEKIVLKVHDSARGGSIPEPDIHESFTAPSFSELVIYKSRR